MIENITISCVCSDIQTPNSNHNVIFLYWNFYMEEVSILSRIKVNFRIKNLLLDVPEAVPKQ